MIKLTYSERRKLVDASPDPVVVTKEAFIGLLDEMERARGLLQRIVESVAKFDEHWQAEETTVLECSLVKEAAEIVRGA